MPRGTYGGPRGGQRFLMSEVPLYRWVGDGGRGVPPVRALVLWCFVLNPHRRSPYPNSQLELRNKLRVSSPVRAIGTNRVLLLPPLFGLSCSPSSTALAGLPLWMAGAAAQKEQVGK